MRNRRSWRTSWTSVVWKSGRDFLCAFLVFALLFAAMTADREIAGPFYLMYLALSQLSPDAAHHSAIVGSVGGVDWSLSTLTTANANTGDVSLRAAFATTAVALLFSVIVAFNLAFFRHLRRVHASSRRGAWRGN